ncbi:MAG TPA: POTRA domain-containing protein [Vicinamibacterales bacterium]|nr:POTRA domain-containing protein [Vicinamibacterales bacterium]
MRLPMLLLLLVLGSAPAAAQSAAARYVGRPVEDLQVLIGNTPTSDPALLDIVEVRVGGPLSMAAVRESITHLHSLGRFQDVQVDATDAPGGGVSVRLHLVPLHYVEHVEFTGSLALSSGLLRRSVSDRFGDSLPIGRADDVAGLLAQVYADNGYLRAAIQRIPGARPDGDRTLTFDIDAGPLARIGSVEIEGDPLESRASFLRRLRAAPGDAYRRPDLVERLNDSQQALRRRRFYQASTSFRATPSENQTVVDLVIAVRRGPIVAVRFDGDTLPPDRVEELVPIQREGSVDEDLLEDSETRIESYLRQQGYWKADVTVSREEADGTLTIVFDVRRGLLYRAASVDIRGSQAIAVEVLRPLVPIQPGAPYVEAQLSTASSAIRSHYLRRGFAAVTVKAGANEMSTESGEGRVAVDIVVAEGPLTLIGDVSISGNTALSEGELRALLGSRSGTPYYEPQIGVDRNAVVTSYLNLGFASVAVAVDRQLRDEGTVVDLVFRIEEGPQTLVDHILIVGNTSTDPRIILRELQLRPGEPLGAEAVFESQRRLSALGLFRRVRITELTHGTSNRHDILVTVAEAPATTIGYGGGIEASPRLRAAGPGGAAEERLEFAPRGFFDVGRRNLWGKNRSVNLFTRVSLRPRDAPEDPEADGTGFGFSEYRVLATYRQPRVLGPNDLSVWGVAEQGVRSSFNFARKGVAVDLSRRFPPAVRVSAGYSFGTTRTFDERLSEEDQATIDRLFPRVRLSMLTAAVVRDTRDELLDPERGTFLSGEGTVALRSLGSQVGFVKTFLQGFWFKRLPVPRRVVFATRAVVGLADGFPSEVPADDGTITIVEDLPASERFFAGGDSTIRGYALDTVGAPDTITPNGFPTGGNAVLIANGELRVTVWGALGAAIFVDGGNVFRRVTDFDLGELRGSVGFGLRYRSPIGPIRVDLGFKLDRREIGGTLERRTALHFSIGQAF